MAEKIPAKASKFGTWVIKPEDWIISLIMANCDIIPNRCRPVLLDVLQKGYIEDEKKFSAVFKILVMIVSGDIVGNDEILTPEDYRAVMEGRDLKIKREETDIEHQEFEEHMRQTNHELFEAQKKRVREATPSNRIYLIPEGDVSERDSTSDAEGAGPVGLSEG